MGADAMRWVYCEQNPSQDLRFGYSLAEDVKRRLLTFWHSVGFLITYANIAEWEPELGSRPEGSHALDRWLVARTQQLVAEAEAAYERYWTPALTTAFEAYVEDLSNWYIRRSRRRFWDGEPEAFETLWWSLVQALRVVGPVMPFFAEHVWDALVEEGAGVGAPRRLARGGRAGCAVARRDGGRCGGWSSSAARRARSRGSSSGSRCAGSSSRAPRRRRRRRARSPTS